MGVRHSKYDLLLVVLVQTVFDAVSIVSIATSLEISYWEFRRMHPDVTVSWLYASPVWVICQCVLMLVLLVTPTGRAIGPYTVFSGSAIVAAVSIQYRRFFLQMDRFVAVPLTACSAAVLGIQLVLIALFILQSVRQRAGHPNARQQ